jgi:ABC-2 type transport system permease protein
MNPAMVVARREVRAYFNSPVAYIVVSAFTIIAGGIFFFLKFFLAGEASLRGFFESMPMLFMFLAPAITMRLLADEKASGTLELLITMPVRDWQVVVGKFLAALTLLATTLLLTLVFAITVRTLGPVDRGPTIGGYLGLLLMGGAYMAIGVMSSAFTKNSIVAFITAFAISFVLFIVGQVTQFLPGSLQGLAAFLGIGNHFENISRGVIDTRDVVYYLSLIGVSLLLATLSLESRRWR